jgi:AraC-like DNA-binding protein
MNYQQILPPDYLKTYIRFFWVMESEDMDMTARSYRTVADGCPGLIFQHPEKGIMYQNDKALPGTFLYGQATQYAQIRLAGTFSTIGIYFYPHALKSIFGLNAQELTDTCINMDLMAQEQGIRLTEQLANTGTFREKIDLLSSYLLCRINKNENGADAEMQYALSRIIASNGSLSLRELQHSLKLSERSFERKFKQHIGIPPKLFSRISRFQASLLQLKNNQYDKLSDIAFENDYTDQSHFIRSFREFAGCSPFQYQKQAVSVMENLTELST